MIDTKEERVAFPSFELMGPPCQTEGCKGVLVDHANWKTKEFYRKCSVCEQKFDQESLGQKTERAIETIERVRHTHCRNIWDDCWKEDEDGDCNCLCKTCQTTRVKEKP